MLEEAIGHAGSARRLPRRAHDSSRLLVRLRTGADGWRPDTVEKEIEATISIFEQAGDEAGLAMAWRLLAWAAGTACRFGDAAEASRHAMEHARRGGRRPSGAARGRRLRGRGRARPDARRRGDRAVRGGDRADGGRPAVRGISSSLCWRASTRCRASSSTRASLAAQAGSMFEELGLEMERARLGMEASSIERLAGDLEAAERELRAAYDVARRSGREVLALDRGGISRADAARAGSAGGGERRSASGAVS